MPNVLIMAKMFRRDRLWYLQVLGHPIGGPRTSVGLAKRSPPTSASLMGYSLNRPCFSPVPDYADPKSRLTADTNNGGSGCACDCVAS